MSSWDKNIVAQRFARHYSEYHECATVQRAIAAELAALLTQSCPELAPARGMEIGMGTGFLSCELARLYPETYWYYNDITPQAFDWIPAQVTSFECLLGDAEGLALPEGLQLLATASTVQWFEDLAGFLTRAREAMGAGGVMALSSFGTQHMHELREITGAGLVYHTREQMAELLHRCGWELLASEEWVEQLYFDTGRGVLEHLRQTGVNGLTTHPWTPRRLAGFHADYKRYFANAEGRLPLSYHPLLLIARTR